MGDVSERLFMCTHIAARAYGVTRSPQAFFLNANHQIVAHTVGEGTSAQLASGLTR